MQIDYPTRTPWYVYVILAGLGFAVAAPMLRENYCTPQPAGCYDPLGIRTPAEREACRLSLPQPPRQ